MKIYIVLEEWAYDTGDSGQMVWAYDTKEKAKERLNALYELDKKEMEERVGDSCNYESTETSFQLWQSGYYDQNHISVSIFEREVC